MKIHSRAARYLTRTLAAAWARFWMRFAGLHYLGRIATRLAECHAPPHKARKKLAMMNPLGYIASSAIIHHPNIIFGTNVFIDDRVVIFERYGGGILDLGDRVSIHRDTILETALNGSITIGHDSSIHPRCQLNAYMEAINIGSGVMIAPNCAFYSYNHGTAPDRAIREQPLRTKGAITIGDEAWIGVGVTVLSGVRIGKGAVIGAGSVVTHNIPDGAIAVGVPAMVINFRHAKPA